MQRGSRRNRLLDRWIGVPLLNLLATGRHRNGPCLRLLLRPSPRIGVMCPPALGDTLLFSAALKDLRAHLDAQTGPGQGRAQILHFCMKENLAAAELIEGADRRVVIDLQRPDRSLPLLRAEALDALIDFTPWQRVTAIHTLLSGAHYTAGFQSAGQCRGRAYDLTVEHRADRHEVDNFRALLDALGVRPQAMPQVVEEAMEERAWRSEWIGSIFGGSAESIHGEDALVVLHPWPAGTQSRLREWPAERWIGLAQRLACYDAGLSFVVTGGPADRQRADALVAELGRAGLRAAGFMGVNGLHSVATLLRRASVAVCVNTGIMHLAAIVGAPTVGLSGPTSNLRWGPLGRMARGIGPEDGSGGYLHFGFEYPAAPEDVMAKISVDQVFSAAVELLPARCAA